MPRREVFRSAVPAGCFWSANANGSFFSASGSGNGNGTVTYSVLNNNGANRVGTISVGNQTFTINQAGRNCTYTITPTQINAPRSGLSGTININTQAGCTYFISRNQTLDHRSGRFWNRAGKSSVYHFRANRSANQIGRDSDFP